MSLVVASEVVLDFGLRYSTDRQPGLSRILGLNGFEYYNAHGDLIRSETTVRRIAALAIPPAWVDVWICPAPRGYLQATGRDAKNRKQFIYHEKWLAHQSEAKFERLSQFGRALPKLREKVEHDLAQHGLPKSKVIAAVVSLLEKSLIRVGNGQYVRANDSFGLTTLENRHAEISSRSIKFSFKGKSGKFHKISLSDRRLARIVRRCQELPGQALFEYCDAASSPCRISSSDVNDYIHRAVGFEFTAKDFRTWAATVETVRLIREVGRPTERELREIIKQVAKKLGNTPAVCRGSYIHPSALAFPAEWWNRRDPKNSTPGVDPIERFVLKHVVV